MKVILFTLCLVNCFFGNAQTYAFPNKTGPESIQFDILNYANPTSITQNKKLELGILLPFGLQTKINNFINKGKRGEKINPYLDWEIRVFAVFKHQQSGEEIEVDGFFTQEYTPWSIEKLPFNNTDEFLSEEIYPTLGGYRLKTNTHPFRVRFSPPNPGKWKCTIKAKVGKSDFTSNEENFEVIESKYEFLKIDKNNRFFELNNKPFMPVGCNIVWPTTNQHSDPELFEYLDYVNNGIKHTINEGYRNAYPVPRVYEKYRKRLNELCDNGVNTMRLIMSPVSTEIEWEELGNYTGRLQMAQEMDQILELAENRGAMLHFCMQAQMTFQNNGPANYYSNYGWDSKIYGVNYCYYNLCEGKPAQFFLINEASKKYFKQRLRYIVSRWGYSTNLSVFDLVGEINQIGNNETVDASGMNTYTADCKPYESWQQEMASFVNSLYYGKKHFISTTYAGNKLKNDNTFASPDMEIMGSNLYDWCSTNFFSHIASFNKFHLNDEEKESYTALNGKANAIRKPFMLMEFDAIDGDCDGDKVDLVRAQWQVLFSGVNGSFSWTMWGMPNTFLHYGKMDTWMKKYYQAGKDWHPGASERKADGSWNYRKEYYTSMDGWFSPKVLQKRFRKADLSYLRAGDKKSAFGVISNKTLNVYSASDCADAKFEFKDKNGKSFKEGNGSGNWYIPPSLRTVETVNALTEKLRLEGMEKGEYDIYYYKLDNLNESFAVSKDNSSNGVDLNVILQPNAKEYMVLFYAVMREK